MKKLIIILIGAFFLAGCSQPNIGAELTLTQKIDAKVTEIQTLMETDKQPNGKYKQRPKIITDGVERRVDEYEKPNGQIGYWITLKKEDANGIYQKVIATGVDKNILEYDWILILDKTIISTSTPIK